MLVPSPEIARRDFVQHWREEEKVVVANEHNVKVQVFAFLEFQGYVNAAEAAAQNQNSETPRG
jgi:hypothetical protein